MKNLGFVVILALFLTACGEDSRGVNSSMKLDLKLTYPIQGMVVGDQIPLRFDTQAEVAKLKVDIDGISFIPLTTLGGGTVTLGKPTFSNQGMELDLKGLLNGQHSIELQVWDAAGNTEIATVSVVVNGFIPFPWQSRIGIDWPKDGSLLDPEEKNTIDAIFRVPFVVSHAEAYLNGELIATGSVADGTLMFQDPSRLRGAHWSIQLPQPLQNGDYAITVKAWSAFGQEAFGGANLVINDARFSEEVKKLREEIKNSVNGGTPIFPKLPLEIVADQSFSSEERKIIEKGIRTWMERSHLPYLLTWVTINPTVCNESVGVSELGKIFISKIRCDPADLKSGEALILSERKNGNLLSVKISINPFFDFEKSGGKEYNFTKTVLHELGHIFSPDHIKNSPEDILIMGDGGPNLVISPIMAATVKSFYKDLL